jgi:hypothetical protein
MTLAGVSLPDGVPCMGGWGRQGTSGRGASNRFVGRWERRLRGRGVHAPARGNLAGGAPHRGAGRGGALASVCRPGSADRRRRGRRSPGAAGCPASPALDADVDSGPLARALARTLARSLARSLGRILARSVARALTRSLGRILARSVARVLAEASVPAEALVRSSTAGRVTVPSGLPPRPSQDPAADHPGAQPGHDPADQHALHPPRRSGGRLISTLSPDHRPARPTT